MTPFSSAQPLLEITAAHKQGLAVGIPSICSAHPAVLDAAMQNPGTGTVLIEATCNQVNQLGGYTGMTPADFARYVEGVAARAGLDPRRILLGGDHLGPNPWRVEPARSALDKARQMVAAYVQAGFAKIHLDASMPCADDASLPPEEIAARAADLCAVAEGARGEAAPVYVIGTEVPTPGGARGTDTGHGLQVTSPADALETIAIFQRAFRKRGLDAAWERVVALVVQPGVEFGDVDIHPYERGAASGLSRAIEGLPGLVYEAHSTDYQTRAELRQLVQDHFAILKVGPGLTFAYREAVFALAHIEEAWLGGDSGVALSGLFSAAEQTMLADPRDWADYYHGTTGEQAFARRYSLSDRMRYYWLREPLHSAVSRLFLNLEGRKPIPLALLSQYLPGEYARVREGRLENTPSALARSRSQTVLEDYSTACAGP